MRATLSLTELGLFAFDTWNWLAQDDKLENGLQRKLPHFSYTASELVFYVWWNNQMKNCVLKRQISSPKKVIYNLVNYLAVLIARKSWYLDLFFLYSLRCEAYLVEKIQSMLRKRYICFNKNSILYPIAYIERKQGDSREHFDMILTFSVLVKGNILP